MFKTGFVGNSYFRACAVAGSAKKQLRSGTDRRIAEQRLKTAPNCSRGPAHPRHESGLRGGLIQGASRSGSRQPDPKTDRAVRPDRKHDRRNSAPRRLLALRDLFRRRGDPRRAEAGLLRGADRRFPAGQGQNGSQMYGGRAKSAGRPPQGSSTRSKAHGWCAVLRWMGHGSRLDNPAIPRHRTFAFLLRRLLAILDALSM